MTRYFFVILIMSLIGIAIVIKGALIMFAERDYWQKVADRFVSENVTVTPNRGNILSTDGKLMASSLPEYRLYMDYMWYDSNERRRKEGQERKDSIFRSNLDTICQGLHRIFPDRSEAAFKKHLLAGRNDAKRRGHWLIYPKRVTHNQYKAVQQLPFFNKRWSGLHVDTINRRKKPFGSLASRTLGGIYSDTAKNGIELGFDSLLRGEPGIARRQKVMNRFLNIQEKAPVDGYDIVSTIDVEMQDICEKALTDKLKELEAVFGVAILMEVKTGEVKAIVNLDRANDGEYYEMKNHAINDLLEPGSTFKTASIMVALEDGKITPHTKVNTGKGIMRMYGCNMKDHNWHHGGYGEIDVTRIMEVSSNIGVSYLIDKHYKDNPQRFVDGLKRMSLDQPLQLQIPGEEKPNIKGPKDRDRKRGEYFSKTSLPWMSIGYETQLPPLNTLTFYNAIANNGVMVRPKFVKAVAKDGNIIEEYPTEVINPKICSEQTLEQIHDILHKVVSQGLGKHAGNKQFSVSGKTGTAQISQGGGYKKGRTQYLVSFCGYFPSENPQYSCIVAIKKVGTPASGGLMAGSVFGKIAERVYAKKIYFDMQNAIDSTSNVVPAVKKGEIGEAVYVLDDLEVPYDGEFILQKKKKSWGNTHSNTSTVTLQEKETSEGVPNVVGMGAKDAVYLLESKGLHVHVSGVGRVKKQSIAAGSHIVKGQTISLTMQ